MLQCCASADDAITHADPRMRSTPFRRNKTVIGIGTDAEAEHGRYAPTKQHAAGGDGLLKAHGSERHPCRETFHQPADLRGLRHLPGVAFSGNSFEPDRRQVAMRREQRQQAGAYQLGYDLGCQAPSDRIELSNPFKHGT